MEHVPDRRSLALLVPPSTDPRREAELVFPRTQVGSSNGAVTSVRAHLDLDNPTRGSIETFCSGLRITRLALSLAGRVQAVAAAVQRRARHYQGSTRSTPLSVTV